MVSSSSTETSNLRQKKRQARPATSLRPSPGSHGWFKGKSSPSMAQLFRSVNYCNSPRCLGVESFWIFFERPVLVPPVVRMSQWDLKIYGRHTEVPWPWLSSAWGNPFRMIFSHLTLWTISDPGFRIYLCWGPVFFFGTIRGCCNPVASPRVTDRLHLCCCTANATTLSFGNYFTTHVLWWFIIWFAKIQHESSTTYHCCDYPGVGIYQ